MIRCDVRVFDGISSRQKTTFPNQKTSNEMTLLDYAVPIRLAHRRALDQYNSGR